MVRCTSAIAQGPIFRVKDGTAEPFATLPASVAAFHLAISPTGELFVSAPTLASYDHVYRIDRQGGVRSLLTPFGRPQGLAFSPNEGVLHVVDALAGGSGLYGCPISTASRSSVATGSGFVGSPSVQTASWPWRRTRQPTVRLTRPRDCAPLSAHLESLDIRLCAEFEPRHHVLSRADGRGVITTPLESAFG
jgi:hypothetical protein